MKTKFPLDWEVFKKIKREHLLLMLLTGILLLVIALPTEKKQEEPTEFAQAIPSISKESQEDSNQEYRILLEQQLQQMLESMEGVGKAKVMITLKDDGETLVEKEIIRTEETGKETKEKEVLVENHTVNYQEETVYVKNENNQEIPMVRKEVKPQVQGVVVVAEGGENAIVKNNISDAILALFSIEAHKIKVVKMN